MHILILHGIGAEAGAHWQRWLGHELEKEGHTVHMPDLPDASHPDRFEWLEYVKGILQDIQTKHLVIVGHSLGVVTALDFIEQSNSKIQGLVAVSGFPRDYGSELNRIYEGKKLDFMKINDKLVSSRLAIMIRMSPKSRFSRLLMNLKSLHMSFPVEDISTLMRDMKSSPSFLNQWSQFVPNIHPKNHE
jgi:predicted alpha/beta hydrolase family esterase